MRIIAGTLRNREILTPKGDNTRPTSSKLRGALFNMCQHSIENANFLDICAGSGAMSFEALSRGAKHATLIENDPRAIQVIKDNVKRFELQTSTTLLGVDALRALQALEKENEKFDICFIDAPYLKNKKEVLENSLIFKILTFLDSSTLLDTSSALFVEDSSSALLANITCKRIALKEKRPMGDSALFIFTVLN